MKMKLHLRERFFEYGIINEARFYIRRFLGKDICNKKCPFIDRCCEYVEGEKCNINLEDEKMNIIFKVEINNGVLDIKTSHLNKSNFLKLRNMMSEAKRICIEIETKGWGTTMCISIPPDMLDSRLIKE